MLHASISVTDDADPPVLNVEYVGLSPILPQPVNDVIPCKVKPKFPESTVWSFLG